MGPSLFAVSPVLSDPLAQMVTLLRPGAPFSKVASAAGPWRVRRSETGRPFYCVVLEGSCRLTADGHGPIVLEAGDFVLIPSAPDFVMSGLMPPTPETVETPHVVLPGGEVRLGDSSATPDLRCLIGYCILGSPDAELLISLLPRLVHVRGETRLCTLVQLVGDETLARRPGRDFVLARLLEVLFIEALRSTAGTGASPGLLRGLADERIAVSLRRMHEAPNQPWTVLRLANEASMSRSAFFERFQRTVGIAPMAYLKAWRMTLAKDLLRRKASRISEVAERVGYGSASTFSTAFARHAGVSPAHFARGSNV